MTTATRRHSCLGTPLAQTWSRTFPARADQVRQARRFLALALEGCAVIDDALLCVSELASNSVLHSASRNPGGTFSVRAEVCRGSHVRVEVRDEGGPWDEQPHADGRPHGLAIVGAMATDSGIDGDALTGRIAWAMLGWPADDAACGDRAAATHLAPAFAWPVVADTRGPAVTGDGRIAAVTDAAATLNTANPALTIGSEPQMNDTRGQVVTTFWAVSMVNRGRFQRLQALEDAIAYRRARVIASCPACETVAPGKCDDHARDLQLIAEYRQAIERASLNLGPVAAGAGSQPR